MSGYVQSLLSEHEQIELVARQHWLVLFGSILMEVILILVVLVGSIALTWVTPYAFLGLLLLLIPVISMVRDILIWRNRQYIVTNRRVVQIAGVFNKSVIDSSLEKVNDVKMEQSALGRMLDYGDIQILTASELGVNRFAIIGAPIRFKTAMLNAKEAMGMDEDHPGRGGVQRDDVPALIEALDVLRQKGVLSAQEFAQKKAELLKRM